MSKKIDLTDSDRRQLIELMNAVNLVQSELAKLADVNQPWLSHVLTGRRKSVDSDMMEKIAAVISAHIKKSQDENVLPSDRAEIAYSFLGRFTPRAAALVPPKIYPPGGLVPVDSVHYILREQDDMVLNALQELPFTMLVSGPVQCGKSSLMARLTSKARDIGIDTVWFDPQSPSRPVPERGKQGSSVDAVAMALSEELQAQWGLVPPKQTPDSITRLFLWLKSELASNSKPMLLILDDLAILDPRSVEDWLSLLVRAITNARGTTKMRVSIAVGLSLQFGPFFQRKLIMLSSIVHWYPRVEVGWFNKNQVGKLAHAIDPSLSNIDDLFRLFCGQPYLTHAAIKDPDFRIAVSRWMEVPTDKSRARSIRGAQTYRRHLAAIRSTILGPTLQGNTETRSLLASFIAGCTGKRFSYDDHWLFLTKANLLNEDGKPKLGIYKLIAEDLSEFIGG
jgi:hypothetical protein